MKKITLVLLTLLTLLPLGAWADEYTNEDITYEYTPGGTTASVKSIDTNATTATILATITISETTYDVTSIAENAFSNCTKLGRTTIPNETLLGAMNNVTLSSLPITACMLMTELTIITKELGRAETISRLGLVQVKRFQVL